MPVVAFTLSSLCLWLHDQAESDSVCRVKPPSLLDGLLELRHRQHLHHAIPYAGPQHWSLEPLLSTFFPLNIVLSTLSSFYSVPDYDWLVRLPSLTLKRSAKVRLMTENSVKVVDRLPR